MEPHNQQEHSDLLRQVVAKDYSYPAERFSGRGIVICAGGIKYLTNAYVNVRSLRDLGCTLPIQIWHLGPEEILLGWRTLFTSIAGVEFVDALKLREKYPARTLRGWEIKPYAIINCPFEEVLLLDADSVAVKNPEYLFSAPVFQKLGSTFWPDYTLTPRDKEIFKICNVPFDPVEFESGQVLVNKRKVWKELQITMHMNEYSDFYYRHMYGDKDTFRFAWKMAGTEYGFIPFVAPYNTDSRNHKDWDGQIVFGHRLHSKWGLYENKDGPTVQRFKECVEYVRYIRANLKDAAVKEDAVLGPIIEQIVSIKKYIYCPAGHFSRYIHFEPDFSFSEGRNNYETYRWTVTAGPTLTFWGTDRPKFQFSLKNGTWQGRGLHPPHQPVCVAPFDPLQLNEIS